MPRWTLTPEEDAEMQAIFEGKPLRDTTEGPDDECSCARAGFPASCDNCDAYPLGVIITHDMEREGQLEFDRPGSTAKSVYLAMMAVAP